MEPVFVGVGIDLVDIARLRNARFLSRVAEFILTERERVDCRSSRDPAEFLASRLAVKEAVIKATPVELSYHDIEITKQGPAPVAGYRSDVGKAFRAHVSLSHVPEYATGVAAVFRVASV